MKNRLEELRKSRGIKQEDLAEALEVSRQTIGSLENGQLCIRDSIYADVTKEMKAAEFKGLDSYFKV